MLEKFSCAAFHDAPLDERGEKRFVAFASYATNLVAGDTNGKEDVFVRGPDGFS